MAEGRRSRRAPREPSARQAQRDRDDVVPEVDARSVQSDAAERSLGNWMSLGVPVLGLVSALIVASLGGLGPSILVLAGTALLGTIAFFWASLRTLSGDAPLPEGMLADALLSRAAPPEKKREALRALKDLELEHSVGKIDDADFKELSSRYRQTAKALMRAMDAGLSPGRERAEKLARAYLDRRGLAVAPPMPREGGPGAASPEPMSDPPANEAETATSRVPCAKCGAANETDAAYCKKCGSALTGTDEENVDASV